jgi:catechol 2,3-dioxygenase
VFQRLLDAHISVGSADHGVSEALYCEDPDGNGIELYRDRPKALRPINSDGNIEMYTQVLDTQDLLSQI